jgi:hypothetical protein
MPYGFQVLSSPTEEPVTVPELKDFLRIDQDFADEDLLVADLGVAARILIEDEYDLALVTQTLQATYDRFPRYSSIAVWQFNSDAIWQQRLPVTQLSGQWYPDRASFRLPRSPALQLLCITYFDGSGIQQTLTFQIAASITAGTQTVTPDPRAMVGITVGKQFVVDVGAVQETITVSSVTTTTFTATFAFNHAALTPVFAVPAVGNTGSPLNGGFLVNIDATTRPARVAPGYGQIWPIVRQQLASVQCTYSAGFGTAAAVPSTIKTALKMLAAHWYEFRAEAGKEPDAVKRLLMSEWSGEYK